MTARAAIGLDLGGTNIKGALVDERARIILKRSVPTNAHRGSDAVIADMAALIEQLIQQSGMSRQAIVGIGVGSPGPLSMRHGVIYHCANLPGWTHVPLRQRLCERSGCSVILENDGNAAAFGEYWTRTIVNAAGSAALASGPAHGAPAKQLHGADVVVLTLGTGVGAGVVIQGRVLQGHFENAAELGHTIMALDGLPCPCGQRGCLEQYASAGAIARRVTAAIRGGADSTLREVIQRGDEIDAAMVADHARSGDLLCARIWDEACLYLAAACVNIQHAYNPERIVMAGGLTAAGSQLLDPVRKHFDARRWLLCRDFPAIELSRLGPDIGALGAAGLAWVNAFPV